MYDLNLQWKEFNISLEAVKTWLEANIETEFSGLSANSSLQIHFEQEPTGEEKEAILACWESLEADSDIAISYQSSAEAEAEKQAVKAANLASAKAKLAALAFLTEDEIKALIG